MPKLQDRRISQAMGKIRPLTPRQRQVLEELAKGGTEYQAYCRLVDSDPSWTSTGKYGDYELTFINFRQHLANAYGRLRVHNRRDALYTLAVLHNI